MGQEAVAPLGLIYCGTTINWPSDVEYTPAIIGLITFSGYGDDDEPEAGRVGPEAMDGTRAKAIPDAFWQALEAQHGVKLRGETDVYLGVAGWTWARLEKDGEPVCSASADGSGYRVIPEEARGGAHTMLVGYC